MKKYRYLQRKMAQLLKAKTVFYFKTSDDMGYSALEKQ
jgi:hypothetical protein